jgi:hypothetical protein
LPETSHIPTAHGFPHRSLDEQDTYYEDEHDDFDAPSKPQDESKKGPKGDDDHEQLRLQSRGLSSKTACIEHLTQLLPRLLDNGEMDKARRVFLILARLCGSSELGLLQNGLWAAGLEVLGRENGGEMFSAQGSAHLRKRLYDFVEELIRRYPWKRTHNSESTSSLHFWYILFSFQIYSIYTLSTLGTCDSVSTPSDHEEEYGDYVEDNNHSVHRRTDDLNASMMTERALVKLRVIEDKMDKLLENQTYSTDVSFRELRGVVSMMTADLSSVTFGSSMRAVAETGNEW